MYSRNMIIGTNCERDRTIKQNLNYSKQIKHMRICKTFNRDYRISNILFFCFNIYIKDNYVYTRINKRKLFD